MNTVTPWKTKMNQEEGFVSIAGTIFQARVEGPRHHQYEDILRYVQQAPDDIRWTIDQSELDELTCHEERFFTWPRSEFHTALTDVRCDLGSQFLFKMLTELSVGRRYRSRTFRRK